MNKAVVGVVIVIILVGIGGFLMRDKLMPNSGTMTETPDTSDVMMQESSESMMMESPDSAMEEGVQEFDINASKFEFSIPEIKVKAGDRVKINFKNVDGMHDFVIDEFNVATKVMNAPYEETIEFVADKPGTYDFYCSVGNHRQMGMEGKLVVE